MYAVALVVELEGASERLGTANSLGDHDAFEGDDDEDVAGCVTVVKKVALLARKPLCEVIYRHLEAGRCLRIEFLPQANRAGVRERHSNGGPIVERASAIRPYGQREPVVVLDTEAHAIQGYRAVDRLYRGAVRCDAGADDHDIVRGNRAVNAVGLARSAAGGRRQNDCERRNGREASSHHPVQSCSENRANACLTCEKHELLEPLPTE